MNNILKKVVITLILFTTLGIGQTIEEIKTKIVKLKEEIAQEEKLWAKEKNRENEDEKNRQKRYDDFLTEKQVINVAIKKTEQDIKVAMLKIENLKNQKKSLENEFKLFSNEILELSNLLSERLNKSFVYQREKRIDDVSTLSSDLRQEKIAAEEGFSRLWALYAKEWKMASEAEIFSGDIQTTDGKDVSVKYVRVGKQIMAYSDASGSYIGWLRKTGDDWVWLDQKVLSYEARQAVRNVVAVAEGKATPGFVNIPIWLDEFKVVQEDKK